MTGTVSNKDMFFQCDIFLMFNGLRREVVAGCLPDCTTF